MYPKAYLEGIRLFNAQHFWHSHEQWEACWHATNDPNDSLFYKGIIQSAAALVHWQRGNPRGLRRNCEKSRSKLVLIPSPYMGIDLAAFMATMELFVFSFADTAPPPVPRIQLLEMA